MADAGQPFLVAVISALAKRTVVVVTEDRKQQDALFYDLQVFLPDVLRYPAWESLPHEEILPEEQTIASRLSTLHALTTRTGPLTIVASVQALLQRTFAPDAFRRQRLALAVGQSVELLALRDQLLALGYHPQVQVGEPGDMAVRGGLLDFYPLDSDAPIRVEFFGDRIESIRAFDPVTQQSQRTLPSVEFAAAGEVGFLKAHPQQTASLTEFLPSDTLLLLIEPEAVALAADAYAKRVPPADPFFVPWNDWLRAGYTTAHITEQIAAAEDDAHINLRVASLEAFRPLDIRAPTPEIAEQSRRAFFEQMLRWIRDGWTVRVFCETDGVRQRFEELWSEFACEVPVATHCAPLSRGFTWEDAKLAVITDAEIFGRYKAPALRPTAYSTAPVADWTEFVEGDFVVHLQHGVGKFLGIRAMDNREVLAIAYANDARLYVPLEQAHLVSKYVGLGKRIPDLHELGGTLWQRQKFRAERAIMDLAAELLEIQAARETLPGHAFSPDTPWQREFEATFPFVETPDQRRAIEQVKADMEAAKPMDRLICGDAGYGKTEVALRAAFKAVMDGYQVAVLCPTTVLAEQHWNVFRQRMAAFPVHVEMLSRFRSRAEQRRIIRRLREGDVDILIGTHRLLSDDIVFKQLGLVIIDEEQRFGVLHKEKFKQYRRLVDVLTLSATPIPRTLYMALTGARDMSVIQTPPANRLPVETHIAPFDERLLRQVIQREIARGGQVFYLHNRVQSIEAVAERLRRLFDSEKSAVQDPPSKAANSELRSQESRRIRIAVAHGQMSERELEEVMHSFVAGHIDVLVCTTIIESGLDIPNANTIIIDRADRFGLADLYQLRGRVGRHNRQAYAYILLPRHMQLVRTARKRISAIKQYSSLGSGYKIAMRDLEIRGAGNLLGAEQSGHISAIGFELYCQLLKESIARLKGQTIQRPPQVLLRLDFLGDGLRIPETYIPDPRLRIEAYRKLAQATERDDLNAVRAEWRDRFGKPPHTVELLLQTAELKFHAAAAHVSIIETRDDKIILTRHGQLYQTDGRFPRFTQSRPEKKLAEIKRLLLTLARSRNQAAGA